MSKLEYSAGLAQYPPLAGVGEKPHKVPGKVAAQSQVRPGEPISKAKQETLGEPCP
jgi:hypothetical protein